MLLNLTGTYKNTVLRDYKTGYTIFVFWTKDISHSFYQDILCEGYVPDYSKGMPLAINVKDKVNGKYNVISVSEKMTSFDVAVSYLSSGICKGIGPESAKAIVSKIGVDLFERLDESDIAEKISEVKGINKDKAEFIVNILKATVVQRELYEYLSRFGYCYDMARLIFETYGIYGLGQLKNNPYRIGEKCGLSFPVCDRIALENHVLPDNQDRLRFIITHTLYLAANQAHTYLPLDEFFKWADRLLKESAFPMDVPKEVFIYHMLEMKNIVVEEAEGGYRLYLRYLYDAEKTAAQNIQRLNDNSISRQNRLYIDKIEKDFNIRYDQCQKDAFSILDTTGVKVLIGGPGTGKTTTIRGIIKNYCMNYPGNMISLCAPTGRAAQKMEEVIGLSASTIHRLLGIKAYEEEKNESNPLEADLIIVDESSMIDMQLMSILMKAVKTDATVIFVGDEDQLPSVGAGNVLHDMLSSGDIEVYRLERIFRQDLDSDIVFNSRQINAGAYDLKKSSDFQVYYCDTEVDIMEKLESLYIENCNEDDSNLEVLTPVRKSDLGCRKLNSFIQKKTKIPYVVCNDCVVFLNDWIAVNKNNSVFSGRVFFIGDDYIDFETDDGKKYRLYEKSYKYISSADNTNRYFLFNQTLFRPNDKIIMTANNYDAEYMNGDIGCVKRIIDNGIVVEIDDKEIEVKGVNLNDVELAYAITIHKSQGSEYPVGIIILPKNGMLERRLLFTAVTRFKEKVIILSMENALELAIANNRESIRYTGFSSKINKKCAAIIK